MNHRVILLVCFIMALSRDANAQPRQGAKAIEIALPAVNGDTLRLSSLRGKVVLLDFWASWCGPCRVANKGLGKIYEKFNDKGFEIYSVSLDKEKEDWVSAIKKDKIKWLQVTDNRGFDAKTAYDWNVYALPTSYLIDRDGTLLAMDLEGKALEKALKSMLDK